jgi:Iron-sulfur cluster-binding domain/Radical SAM superfamily
MGKVRPQGLMPMPLFKKIIDEAVTIDRLDHYTLTGLGETLLDRHIVERIKYVRSKHKNVMLDLYTNGSFLTPKMSDALRDAGLSILYVSLNAVRAEQRKAIMRVDDFDKVCDYIDYAIAHAGDMKIIVKAVVSKDLLEVGDTEDFQKRWGGDWNKGGHAYMHLEGNWAGAQWPMRIAPTRACPRALNEFMVLWDGRVSLCCFDGAGEVIFGDLKNQTIREVFASEKAQYYRLAHVEGRRSELPLCNVCTAI